MEQSSISLTVSVVALIVAFISLLRSPKKEETKKTPAENYNAVPLQLQAYERLVLFTDRINPSNLLIRLNGNSYSAAELHSIILNEVRTEYQHNITQQIYVSPQAWAVIRRVKDDTLNLITSAVKGLPEHATGLDLGKVVLTHLSKLEDNPYDIAIDMIRKDLEHLF